MTGHQINSLVGDLVAMAQAMERVPMLESELNVAIADREDLTNTVQRLELKLMDAKNLEETLRSAIRDLEVARDDAELRFLEAEEQHGKIANAFQVALEAMDHADKIVARAHDALHPLPPPMPEPTTTISEVKPITADPTDATVVTGSEVDVSGSPVTTSIDASLPQDQRDPLPTPAQPSPTGTGTESVASDTEPTKYLVAEGGWSYINPEWESWRDRQPPNSSTW